MPEYHNHPGSKKRTRPSSKMSIDGSWKACNRARRMSKTRTLWPTRVSQECDAGSNHTAHTRYTAALPQDLLQEAVPGNIRRAEHFTAFLARFVEYLKVSPDRSPLFGHLSHHSPSHRPACESCTSSPKRPCRSCSTCATSPLSNGNPSSKVSFETLAAKWMPTLENSYRFCAERLSSLVRTLELTRIDEFSALQKVAAFATLVATYHEGEPDQTTHERLAN